MPELLLEVFSEEIPARMQKRAADDLARLVGDRLKTAGLDSGESRICYTPRRLTLCIDGLPAAQPDVREERRGPRADAPDKAIDGFLKGNGLTREQCEERETPKGTFLFAVIERKGRPTAEVLAELLPDSLAALPWPKSMRWGSGETRWVRPLHSILALFDGAVVPFEFAGVASGNQTRGHRFHAPDAFSVTDFRDYCDKLLAAKVVIDPDARKREIVERAAAAATEAGLTLVDDPALVDEITGLVEWPVAVLGSFDRRFMDVPREVLVTTMRVNQKYLSLNDADGRLAPNFITLANLEARDGGAQVRAGNEYVLTARLSDAEFFWNQDRKVTLESRVPKLSDMVFHAKLGSILDKVGRMEALARALAEHIPGADPDLCARAARLAKADLVSDMVFEFPELQGIMGRYYALNDGEDATVAEAIATHYAPQGPGDTCPTDPVAVCVALADKIDTLVGFWSIDEKPTGSRDPYALRRAALGVIRLVLENDLRIQLTAVFDQQANLILAESLSRENEHKRQLLDQAGEDDHPAVTTRTVPAGLFDGSSEIRRQDSLDLLAFFADRLRVHLREEGVRHDLISAVFALDGEDDLVRLLARVEALQQLVESDDGANLLTAYRRAANILRIEEGKDGVSYDGEVTSSALEQDEEKKLAAALQSAAATTDTALAQEDFTAAMGAMAALRTPVDAFFDKVTVNTENSDLRANRLRLLSGIRSTLHRVADFSAIEG